MIFYRPFLIEKTTEINCSSFLEIEAGNFFIGQVMDITDWNETLIGYLKPKNLDQVKSLENTWQALGQVIELSAEKTRIAILGNLQGRSLENLVVRPASFTIDFSIFSPSILGRFFASPNFLETQWQSEEVHGQLLGSKLLEGKKVDYSQKPLNWQTAATSLNQITTSPITIISQLPTRQKIDITWPENGQPQDSSPELEPVSLKIGQTNYMPKPLGQNFSQLASGIISQIKDQLIQPLFIIVSKTCDHSELKSFYFNLAETENLFNCLVIVSPNQDQNKLWQDKARQIGQFLHQSLDKPIFLIFDWQPEVSQTETDLAIGLTEIHFISQKLVDQKS